MAVYWCDPFIEAPIAGIHGTSDTTSRSGTYSAPWALSDLFATTSSNNTKLSPLSDGDEIRLKGQALNSYLVDAGTDYYADNYTQTIKNSAHETAVITALSDHPQTSSSAINCLFITDKTQTDNWTCPDSAGNKPPVLWDAMFDSPTSPSAKLFDSYTYSPMYIFNNSVNRKNATGTGNANLSMKLVHPEYYIPLNWTGNQYFACYDDIGLKITDGWTSSSAQGGLTILSIIRTTSSSSTQNWYFNASVSSSTGPCTHYDMLNTFIARFSSTGGASNGYARMYPCTGSYSAHHGKDVIHKLGGWLNSDSGSALIYDYTQYYYNTAYGSNSNDAINSIEVTATSNWSGIRTYSRYGNYGASNTTPATKRYSNCYAYNAPQYHYSINYDNLSTYKIGTVICQTNSTMHVIQSNSSKAAHFDILDGAYFYKHQSFGGTLFPSTQNSVSTFSFDGAAYNYETGSYLSDVNGVVGSMGPQAMLEATVKKPYVKHVDFNPTDWRTKYLIKLNDTASWAAGPDYTTVSAALGLLDLGSSDYKSDDFKHLVYYSRAPGSDTLANDYLSTPYIHFSGNTADGRPIGLMVGASSDVPLAKVPMIYYNDVDKSDALCFKSNSLASNQYYITRLERQMPGYTSSNTVTFSCTVESESTHNKYKKIRVLYVDNTGALTYATLLNTNAAITTQTSYTTAVNGSSMYLSDNDAPIRHCLFTINVENEATNSSKFWVHDLSVTVS